MPPEKSIYHKFEEFVFHKLLEEKKKTHRNFSLRQKASLGAERDYFIGKETAKYFSFTYWNIPVSLRSPNDVTDFIFENNKGKWFFKFAFLCPIVGTEDLDLVLEAGKKFKEIIGVIPKVKIRENGNSRANYVFELQFSDGFEDFEELWVSFSVFRDEVFEKFNEAVEIIKNEHESLKISLISDDLFSTYQIKLEERLKRYPSEVLKPQKDQIFSYKPELNQIFYGPPGTGKTYRTIDEAIRIVDAKYYEENKESREKLQNRFNELLLKEEDNNKGQIAFCTFHQSFSYEDFVEGIKPMEPSEGDIGVKYKTQDGIFKMICKRAVSDKNAKLLSQIKSLSLSESEFRKALFYKLSLGDSTKEEDREIYEYCAGNNVIAIGLGGNVDFSGLDETAVTEKVKRDNLENFVGQGINYFKNYIKNGDYVIISNGNSYIRGLAKVIGDYEFEKEPEIAYHHFRKVEWIFKDVVIHVNEFYQKNLSQQSIYKLKSEFIKPDFFISNNSNKLIESEEKKFVLIIDEINRGNVSSIFGELITLIEPSKRDGGNDKLEVQLPYSKSSFSVPSNIFIIGTMNTADRGIEALDTALRRRFSFLELAPDPDVIATDKESEGIADDINLVELLKVINSRIEILIDKDHKIGHSYFLGVTKEKQLKKVFNDKIIPLLEEYFFGDYGKIGLVLGKSFVKKSENQISFADFPEYESGMAEEYLSKNVFEIRPNIEWDFNSIYQ